nr:hypothetical protein [Tanacetum cinerariifolium]GEZ75827.1 hypothetical protein [Tanacetum cinerariifolium]
MILCKQKEAEIQLSAEQVDWRDDTNDEPKDQKLEAHSLYMANVLSCDYQLTERLQAEEQQELNDEEKAKLFMQLLKKRRKFLAAKRVEEKRNKPPTQAQKRKIMCTYLKNIEGKKLTDLKNESFDSIQKMFDKAFKMINTFVDYITELVEESSKKDESEVTEESSKRAGTELE